MQIGVSRSVIELYCLDTAKVVVIACVLRIWSRSGEIRFRDEFVRLIIETVMEVTAKKAIDEGSLGLIVVAKGCSSLGCKEEAR